jgi:hypothetical protein
MIMTLYLTRGLLSFSHAVADDIQARRSVLIETAEKNKDDRKERGQILVLVYEKQEQLTSDRILR